jgi:hypothetical protein
VCLDIPYPPDYGGVFDLFYKIKTLHELGVKIHLHCFEYGRGEQPELNTYCHEVHYYRREKLTGGIPLRLPYIVSSRIQPLLIQAILKDAYPVLLEGIHCTYYLYHGDLNHRNVLVRLHNVEFEYYHRLAVSTRNFYKKIYFSLESRLLRKYEGIIARKGKLIAVNKKDQVTYQTILSAKNAGFLPVFLPFTEVTSRPGMGDYCLYHGNLSVAENERAVEWLMEQVFDSLDIPFIVAGKDPSPSLRKTVGKNKNARIIENPSRDRMEELIKNAQLHVLPSFNSTGIKIKLLHALFTGRFVITNAATTDGTGLESLCAMAEKPADYRKKILELSTTSFSAAEINKRQELLGSQYNNEKNGRRLMEMLGIS